MHLKIQICPFCRVKNQNYRKPKCDLLKPISRKIQNQWKNNQLNLTDLVGEKSQLPFKNWYFQMVPTLSLSLPAPVPPMLSLSFVYQRFPPQAFRLLYWIVLIERLIKQKIYANLQAMTRHTYTYIQLAVQLILCIVPLRPPLPVTFYRSPLVCTRFCTSAFLSPCFKIDQLGKEYKCIILKLIQQVSHISLSLYFY